MAALRIILFSMACVLLGADAFDLEISRHFDLLKVPFNRRPRGDLPPAGDRNKIFGGSDVEDNEFPFVVSITLSGGTICSGSLIDKRWVLTTASCASTAETGSSIIIVLGVNDRSTTESTRQELTVAEVVRHPNYNGFNNAIGLIKLKGRANVGSEAIGTAAVLKSASFKEKALNNEKTCWMLGWGLSKYESGWYETPRMKKLPTRFVNATEAADRGQTSVHEGVLRTETIYEDECERGSFCSGDNGGPVVCKKGGSWVVVAIALSFSPYDGCVAGIKGNVDAQAYADWIDSIIG